MGPISHCILQTHIIVFKVDVSNTGVINIYRNLFKINVGEIIQEKLTIKACHYEYVFAIIFGTCK